MGNMTTEKKPYVVQDLWIFDDFQEFIDTCADLPEPEPRWNASREEGFSYMEDWTGTKSWDHALQMAREGWPEGFRQFDEKLTALTPYVVAAQSEHSEDLAPAGYFPNVPAFCAGSPACMHAPGENLSARTPVLRLLVNRSALGSVDSSEIMNRGAVICALVDYFENIGIRVEINVCMAAQGRQGRTRGVHEVHVPVKRATEQFDPDRMAFVLAQPTLHRRLGFALRESNHKLMRAFGDGYGASTDITPDPDQVYFPCLHSGRGLRTEEQALHTVLGQLREQLDDSLVHKIDEDWADILDPDSRLAV